MNTLNSFSINRPHYIISSALPKNNSSSPSPHFTEHTSKQIGKADSFQQAKEKQRTSKRQPTILEVEKAIGAGSFREREPNRESEENMNSLEGFMSKSLGKNESFAEKQLRETGEWINQKAEKPFRSASKPILLFLVQWMLPTWILAFFVLSGIIKLPFHSPLLDDLLL